MFLESKTRSMLFAGAMLASVAGCRGGDSAHAPSGSDTDGQDTSASAPGSGDEGSTTAPGHGTGSSSEGESSASETDDGLPPDDEQAPSVRAHVKFKTAHRQAMDLAAALDLPVDALCRELSTHDCFELHRISLGEVDAYDARIFEPLPEPPVTAAVAVERIGLAACGERVERDFESPGDAVIFGEITQGGAGDPEARRLVAERLYRRLLLREPEVDQVEALVEFHGDLQDEDTPARTWAQLACFAIATSEEALFY